MDLEFWESVNLAALQVFAAGWIFALGAILGSFLNVVVYRLPRGMPMGMVVSRCPKCTNPIAFRDNVPILSWLWLRGRCRSCGQGISTRYPLVEATAGGLFLLLFYVELVSGGANLPVRQPNPPGLMALISTMPWDLLGIYFYHCALLYLLLGIALMQWDGRPIPRRYWLTAIVIGFLGAAFHPVAMSEPYQRGLSIFWKGLEATCAGFLCGWGLGVLYRVVHERSLNITAAPRAVDLTWLLVGLFLGWQALFSVALAALIVGLPLFVLSLVWPVVRRVPISWYLGLLTLVHLITWRMHSHFQCWPNPNTPFEIMWVVASPGWLLLMLIGARQRGQDGW